ncbi:MAG: HEAT repeat domain-containing protein [Gemmataceae bacterium]|nr:HEAT repeat domain-containing protein [Gemmataceae bacterium]
MLRTLSVMVIVVLLGIVVSAASAQRFLGKDVPGWLAELAKGDDKARRNAAFALGKMGFAAADAVPALLRALTTDSSVKVRDAAAFALGEIVRNAKQMAAADPKYDAYLAKALDKELVRHLTRALKDEAWQVRRSAAFALGCLEKDGLAGREALEEALSDPAPQVRQNAAWALGRSSVDAVAKLRGALADADPYVKRDAVQSLDLLTYEEPTALRPALPDLLRLCSDTDSEVRRASVKVLIRLVSPKDAKEAIEPLRRVVANAEEDREIRVNAALALANIGGTSATAAIDVLINALHHGDLDVRRQAAAAVGKFGKEAARAVGDLITALKDQDVEVRQHAAMALGDIGPSAEAAVPALVALLTNTAEHAEARKAAGAALKQIGNNVAAIQAVPRLVAMIANRADEAAVRERAVWALQVHGLELRKMDGVVAAFVKVVNEPKTKANRMLRYTCACILGVLQRGDADPAALDTLADFLHDTDVAIYEGVQATAQGSGIESGTGKTVVKELSVGDARVNAVEALQYIGAARVGSRADIVRQLRMLADDPKTFRDLRKKCIELLRELGS